MINGHSGRRASAAVKSAMAATLAVVTLAVVTLALAGCSGGSDPVPTNPYTAWPTAIPTTSTTTPTTAPASTSTPPGTATATGSPTRSIAKPVVPEAAKHPTGAGAEAYFLYFWETYNYAFDALDTDPLDEASDPKCIFCSNSIQTIKRALDTGESFTGGRVSVDAAVAVPGTPEKGIVVNGTIEQTAAVTHDASGKPVVTDSPDPPHRVDAFLTWNGDSWRVGAVSPGN